MQKWQCFVTAFNRLFITGHLEKKYYSGDRLDTQFSVARKNEYLNLGMGSLFQYYQVGTVNN